MKKISLVTLFILVVAVIYKVHDSKSNHHHNEWETFGKSETEHTDIISWKTTKKELVQAREDVPSSPKRVPSSIAKGIPKVRMIAGREVTGDRKANATHLKWVNSFDPEWKEKLGHSLLKFQQPDAKVLVKKNKSVVEIRNGKGRLLEHVTIKYLLEGDDSTSFNAWVDSETGELVRTWNKTIKEPVGALHKKPTLTPSGTL